MASRWSRTVAFACLVLVGACGSDDSSPIGASPQSDAGLDDASVPDGSALDASAPDSGASACDDGDPCTTDVLVDGTCTHTTAPDGTPCSDGRRCTGEDRCESGVCRGTELTPHVQARGHVIGFGAAPNEDGHPLNGLQELVSDEHMLFLDSLGSAGTALSLVQLTAAGLPRLDVKELDVSLGWDFPDSPDASRRTTTLLVPLGDDRAAVIASQKRIEIFDTSTGKIMSVGQLALHPQSETILAAVGRGSRFYTCADQTNTAVVDAWEVGPTGTIFNRGGVALPNISSPVNTCSSLALSPDGLELLVATHEGIDRIDVTDPTAMTLATRFLPGQRFWRVAEQGGFVVAQLSFGTASNPLPIVVYRRSALEASPYATPELVISSTPDGQLPARWPIGFAFLDGALAVEWKVHDANGFRYETKVQALPGGAPHNASFTHRSEREDRMRTRPFVLASRGQYLVVPPWRTVLRHEPVPVAGSFTVLGEADTRGFEAVLPGASGHVTALSGLGVHDVNLQDPDAPSVSGQPLSRDVSFYRWLPGSAHRLAAPLGTRAKPGALTLGQTLTPIGCFASAGGSVSPSGVVNVADDVDIFYPAHVIDLGRALLHVNPLAGYTSVRLRWYDAPNACDGRTLAASVDGLVDVHPEHLFFAAGGDVTGKQPAVVLADIRELEPSTLAIHWLERASGSSGWKNVASVELQSALAWIQHVEVRGDLALLHDTRRILVVRRSGSTLSVVTDREILDAGAPEELSEILRFDDELVFATTKKVPQGVVVLRTHDLERVARFSTHGLVRSMAEVSGSIAFGSANAIDVVDSVCPP